MRGRPKAELMLTEPEREELVALTLRRKTAQALALRARIVLVCADGQDSKAVAALQRVTPQTVGKWRARYVERRLDGLLDAPRSTRLGPMRCRSRNSPASATSSRSSSTKPT